MSKLKEMLKYVSEHNDFYKNIIREYSITDPTDITQYPILTRQQLQENRYNMFSEGYKTKYFNQELRRQASSGSSGIPVNVYWDRKDWYVSNLSLWRKRLKWHGICPNDKYVIFTLNAFNIKSEGNTVLFINEPSNVLIINVSLIHSDNEYKIIAEKILEFNPIWLYIQPFILNKLIQAFTANRINIPSTLQYIESVGEVLPADLRNRAHDCFGIEVINMYGSEEFNGIAYERSPKAMCVLEDNVYVEVLRNNSIYSYGQGEAIITSINNYAMPLIRYNQEDIISVNNVLTTNGRKEIFINRIAGRVHKSIDFFNSEINSFMLSEIISEVNNEFNDPIKEYKFIYKHNVNILMCLIVIDEKFAEWSNEIIESIKNVFLSKGSKYHHTVHLCIEQTQAITYNNAKNSILEIIN